MPPPPPTPPFNSKHLKNKPVNSTCTHCPHGLRTPPPLANVAKSVRPFPPLFSNEIFPNSMKPNTQYILSPNCKTLHIDPRRVACVPRTTVGAKPITRLPSLAKGAQQKHTPVPSFLSFKQLQPHLDLLAHIPLAQQPTSHQPPAPSQIRHSYSLSLHNQLFPHQPPAPSQIRHSYSLSLHNQLFAHRRQPPAKTGTLTAYPSATNYSPTSHQAPAKTGTLTVCPCTTNYPPTSTVYQVDESSY
jgi:hypothetical protein